MHWLTDELAGGRLARRRAIAASAFATNYLVMAIQFRLYASPFSDVLCG